MITIVVLNHLLKKTFYCFIFGKNKKKVLFSFFLCHRDKYVLTEIIIGPSCLCICIHVVTCFIHKEIMFFNGDDRVEDFGVSLRGFKESYNMRAAELSWFLRIKSFRVNWKIYAPYVFEYSANELSFRDSTCPLFPPLRR